MGEANRKSETPSSAGMALQISLPPEELRKQVAVLLAAGLSKCRPPCVIVEKIKASELEAVANYVIGGFLGLASAGQKGN